MNYKYVKYMRYLLKLDFNNAEYDYYRKLSFSDEQLAKLEKYVVKATKNDDYDKEKFIRFVEKVCSDNQIYNSSDLFNQIRRLNKGISFDFNEITGKLTSDKDISEIVLPEGFYYDGKNGITNEKTSNDGVIVNLSYSKNKIKDGEPMKLEPITERRHYKEEKVSIFTRIKNFFNRNNKSELNVGKVPAVKERKYFGIRKLISNIKEKFSKKTEKNNQNVTYTKRKQINDTDNNASIDQKIEEISNSLSKYDKIKRIYKFAKYNDMINDEVNGYVKLLDEQDNNEKITEMFNYVNENKDNITQEDLLNKFADVTGIPRYTDIQLSSTIAPTTKEEKIVSKLPEQEVKVIEKQDIKEKDKQKDKKIEVSKEEKEKRDITILNSRYNELKNELDSKFTQEEIMCIEDAHSEGLKLGDQEFNQMLIERAIDKRRIYAYLLNLEKIKLLSIYDNLNEYEKMFIEDTHSESLNKNDQEYNQMVIERNINMEIINKYYEILNKSKEAQNKIMSDYKKEFIKMDSVQFDDKKVSELKEIAKENELKNISKMKKAELIQKLNELKALKEQEAINKLNLK